MLRDRSAWVGVRTAGVGGTIFAPPSLLSPGADTRASPGRPGLKRFGESNTTAHAFHTAGERIAALRADGDDLRETLIAIDRELTAALSSDTQSYAIRRQLPLRTPGWLSMNQGR